MGTLFPDSPEHPDHKSLPSGTAALKDAAQDLKEVAKAAAQEAKEQAPAYALIGMFVISGEGPENLVKPDYRAMGRQAISWQSSATSSITATPLHHYNWPVPQPRSSSAHFALSSTNHALLFGDTPTTTQDWFPQSTGIFKASND